jgi:hypothetical protein
MVKRLYETHMKHDEMRKIFSKARKWGLIARFIGVS